MQKEIVKVQEKIVERKEIKTGRLILCDICKRKIFDSRDRITAKSSIDVGYWEAVTGHNDWGSDSFESIKTHDICSTKCLDKLVEAYELVSKNSDNSWYMEIHHMDIHCHLGMKDDEKKDLEESVVKDCEEEEELDDEEIIINALLEV